MNTIFPSRILDWINQLCFDLSYLKVKEEYYEKFIPGRNSSTLSTKPTKRIHAMLPVYYILNYRTFELTSDRFLAFARIPYIHNFIYGRCTTKKIPKHYFFTLTNEELKNEKIY